MIRAAHGQLVHGQHHYEVQLVALRRRLRVIRMMMRATSKAVTTIAGASSSGSSSSGSGNGNGCHQQQRVVAVENSHQLPRESGVVRVFGEWQGQ